MREQKENLTYFVDSAIGHIQTGVFQVVWTGKDMALCQFLILEVGLAPPGPAALLPCQDHVHPIPAARSTS